MCFRYVSIRRVGPVGSKGWRDPMASGRGVTGPGHSDLSGRCNSQLYAGHINFWSNFIQFLDMLVFSISPVFSSQINIINFKDMKEWSRGRLRQLSGLYRLFGGRAFCQPCGVQNAFNMPKPLNFLWPVAPHTSVCRCMPLLFRKGSNSSASIDCWKVSFQIEVALIPSHSGSSAAPVCRVTQALDEVWRERERAKRTKVPWLTKGSWCFQIRDI